MLRAFTCLLCLAVVPMLRAQFLGGFATELTQIANNVQLVSSYIRMGLQLQQELLMVADMIKQGNILPSQVFGSVLADSAKLNSVVQNGQAIAYSMQNLDAAFNSRFSGYGYVGNSWYLKYRAWSQTSLDSTLGALKAANMQASQMNSEEALLQQLRAMSVSADGRMKAIEVGNQINEQMVQQMMKLREIMLADLQGKSSFQAAQIQKDAAAAASAEQFFNRVTAASDPRKY